MKVIVDKIEGDIASVELENGEIVNVPKVILDDAKERDVVEIKVCKDETIERREHIQTGFCSK